MEVFEEFATPPLPTVFTYYEATKELVVEYSGTKDARVFLDVPAETFELIGNPDNKRRNSDWLGMEHNFVSITLEEWLDGVK